MSAQGITKKPNFLIIVADDLGFSDIGAFGGEIETPNLDKLALDGLRFTQFHTAAACSPTRSMLLSGTDNHLAGLGQMAEFARGYPDLFDGKPGYEGYLNFQVAALPEILSPEYYTLISGKWHLGLDEPYWPDKRGFEKSFTLLPGAGNHYKYRVREKSFMPFIYQENGNKLDPEKDLPDDFYSTQYFTNKFLNYLGDSEARKGRPFLGLLTYTAPHWPLQAPENTIAKYKGKYDGGPLNLRRERLKRAAKLNIISEDVVPHLLETQRDKTWDQLTDEEKAYSSRIMETYAAMVDELDKNIGRVIEELKVSGELENTMTIFMSDNGAEGMLMEALPFGGTTFKSHISEHYNNYFENVGKRDSFVYYGDLWAQAATAPNYMYKMWTTEGGINCPLIFHYPALTKRIPNQDITDQFSTVMDILPTILDIANIPHPGTEFRGRHVHEPRGLSWKPYLTGHKKEIYNEKRIVGWELFGQRAIRNGNYKVVYIPPPFGEGKWTLFDIVKDPGETTDLSQEFPDVWKKLVDHWSVYCSETGLVELNEYEKGTKYKRTVIKD